MMNKEFLWNAAVSISVIITILIFTSCSDKEEDIFKPLPLSVRAGEVTRKRTAPEISAFGTVLYYSKADVYPTTEGYINSVEVMEGDRVVKGELLSQLRQEKLFIEREKSISEVNSKRSLLRLAEEKLYSGKREAEKKIISIKGALNSLNQKKLELDNVDRIYCNKQELFEAGGLSQEELESVKMTYLKSRYEYEKSLNDLELVKTGYRECDIRDRGFLFPVMRRKKTNFLSRLTHLFWKLKKKSLRRN